jgi:uncharacterized membrane protein YfhO
MNFFSNANIKGTISLSQAKFLFFSIPYDKGWSAVVNGQPMDLEQVNIGFSGLMLPKGEHNIELIYATPYAQIGRWISVVALLFYLGLLIRYKAQNRLNSKQVNQAI